jgi:hypothetical protein
MGFEGLARIEELAGRQGLERENALPDQVAPEGQETV